MATTVTIRRDDAEVPVGTAIHVSTTELDANTSTGYDAEEYPASPAVTYYFTAENDDYDDLVSQVFSPNGGKGYWEGLTLPVAGLWTVHVRKTADDTSVANETVTAV